MFLVGSTRDVSAVFWLRFRMVWALHFFLFSGFQKRRFGIFPAAVSQWLGHKTCWGSAFSHARPKHLFLEFGLVACRLPSLTLRKGLPCLRQPFFFVFSRFQKQRFGIFLFSAFFVGSKSNVSAVFWLRFRMVWAYIPFFLMGSNSDVSAFFRLRFRNGLGTKPAGVLPFRMRVPNTFFLSLAWWLAGFFFVFSRVQKQRFGSFLAAVSHGLGPISFSGWSIPETCHPSPNHCFDRPHPILLSPLLGVGGMGGSPSIKESVGGGMSFRACPLLANGPPRFQLGLGLTFKSRGMEKRRGSIPPMGMSLYCFNRWCRKYVRDSHGRSPTIAQKKQAQNLREPLWNHACVACGLICFVVLVLLAHAVGARKRLIWAK